MAGTSFTMDMSRLTGMVEDGLKKIERRQSLMEAIGETMVASTLRRFEKGVGPDGTAWEANQRGGQTLVDTARLKGSFTYEASLEQVVWGTNVEYAAIHQFGGKTGRNHAVILPARPFVGIDQDDREEMQEMMRLFLLHALGG